VGLGRPEDAAPQRGTHPAAPRKGFSRIFPHEEGNRVDAKERGLVGRVKGLLRPGMSAGTQTKKENRTRDDIGRGGIVAENTKVPSAKKKKEREVSAVTLQTRNHVHRTRKVSSLRRVPATR